MQPPTTKHSPPARHNSVATAKRVAAAHHVRVTTTQLNQLASTLRAAAAAYYDGTEELMTDAAYDDGLEQLRTAIATDPALIGRYEDLLTQVAAGQSAGGDVTHPTRMGSLDKVVGLDAVTAFVSAIAGPVAIEPKLDGLAIRAQYDTDGYLSLVATRGDGTTGEDITRGARNLRIQGLPSRVDPTYGVREVRGEVYCADADFLRAQAVRQGLGGAAFVNSRNAAAGILRKGDKAYAGILSFAAYGAELADPPTSGLYDEAMQVVSYADIATAAGLLLGMLHTVPSGREDLADVLAQVNALDAARESIGFPIDGIVLKADAAADRKLLGEGDRAPRWAVAYKYEAEAAVTKVVAITTAVGRTGRLAIRIEVEPVFVGGTTVTFATGHNVAWMQARDVRVGDTVTIKRANDVIPYVVAVDLHARPAGSAPWQPPATDPNGGEWDKSTLLWRSVDPSLSVGATLRYAVSRDALDVEGMGTEVVDALVETGLVTRLPDLWNLTLAQLTDLPLAKARRLGEKNATKILTELDKARTAPWARVITALGLRMTGRTMSRRLAAAFPDVEALLGASVADLAAVDGIGEVKARVIYDELRARLLDGTDERPAAVDALRAAGVTLGAAGPAADAADLPLAGMSVVVSGSVPGYTRTTVAELIEAKGGRASSSVSATTGLLVSEPSTSSKYTKATKLGVRILTPTEFLGLLD